MEHAVEEAQRAGLDLAPPADAPQVAGGDTKEVAETGGDTHNQVAETGAAETGAAAESNKEVAETGAAAETNHQVAEAAEPTKEVAETKEVGVADVDTFEHIEYPGCQV